MLGSAFTELYLWWFAQPRSAFLVVFLMLLAGWAVIGAFIAMDL